MIADLGGVGTARYLPDWLPFMERLRYARTWRPAIERLTQVPFEESIKIMVSVAEVYILIPLNPGFADPS
jgi:hypothetical protein